MTKKHWVVINQPHECQMSSTFWFPLYRPKATSCRQSSSSLIFFGSQFRFSVFSFISIYLQMTHSVILHHSFFAPFFANRLFADFIVKCLPLFATQMCSIQTNQPNYTKRERLNLEFVSKPSSKWMFVSVCTPRNVCIKVHTLITWGQKVFLNSKKHQFRRALSLYFWLSLWSTELSTASGTLETFLNIDICSE